MAALYQLTSGTSIMRKTDGAMIPTDPGNLDYQAYLVWTAAGNKPDPAPVPPPATQIQAAAFLARFTPVEQAAVQQAALANQQIALGLTMGLAQGYVDLTSPVLAAWMAALVTAGAITAARSAVIMTP